MFGNVHSSACDDETGCGGDIEPPFGVTTGTAGVDSLDPAIDVQRHISHNRSHAGDLLRRFAFHTEGCHERAELGFGGLTAHDLRHHVGGLGLREVNAVDGCLDALLDVHGCDSGCSCVVLLRMVFVRGLEHDECASSRSSYLYER